MILSVAVHRQLKWTATINLSYQDILGGGSRINRLIIHPKSFRSDQTWTDNWSLDLYPSLQSDESGRGRRRISTSYRNFILFFWKKYTTIRYISNGKFPILYMDIEVLNTLLRATAFYMHVCSCRHACPWFLGFLREWLNICLCDFRVDKLWSR